MIKITEDVIKEKINSADYSTLEDVKYYYGEPATFYFSVLKNDILFKVDVELYSVNHSSLCFGKIGKPVKHDKRANPLIIVQFDGQYVFKEEVKGDGILNTLKYKMSLRENYVKNKFLQI